MEGVPVRFLALYDAGCDVGGEGEKKPNADRLEQDKSDQITNSPSIDGMSTK